MIWCDSITLYFFGKWNRSKRQRRSTRTQNVYILARTLSKSFYVVFFQSYSKTLLKLQSVYCRSDSSVFQVIFRVIFQRCSTHNPVTQHTLRSYQHRHPGREIVFLRHSCEANRRWCTAASWRSMVCSATLVRVIPRSGVALSAT